MTCDHLAVHRGCPGFLSPLQHPPVTAVAGPSVQHRHMWKVQPSESLRLLVKTPARGPLAIRSAPRDQPAQLNRRLNAAWPLFATIREQNVASTGSTLEILPF